MKKLFTILLLLITCGVFAQGYKPMNGYYDFKGNLRFSDTMFVDTSALDVSSGTNISLDTANSSTSGYYRIITSTNPTIVSGDSNRIAFYSGASTISSSATLKYTNSTRQVSLDGLNAEFVVDGLGSKITNNGLTFMLDTAYLGIGGLDSVGGDFLSLDTTGISSNGYGKIITKDALINGSGAATRLTYWSDANTITQASGLSYLSDSATLSISSGDGGDSEVALDVLGNRSILIDSNEIFGATDGLRITPRSGQGFSILTQSDTALYITADGAVGIHTNTPSHPLTIKGAGGSEVTLGLVDTQTEGPGPEVATTGGFPAGASGDPDIFLVLSINGTNYVFPGWTFTE